jgi:cellobiose phosphorylase
VYHWWHPLSEQGHITKMTDDLLWLAFVVAHYIRETGDITVLDDKAPFLDEPAPQPVREHVRRAFARVFQRCSARGLPFIGAGDWNDGLSAVGLQEKGESFWLAQFLAGLLGDWTDIYRRTGDAARADEFARRRAALIQAINTHGWDGKWYIRATLDDGSLLGSSSNRVGRIFLNAQTWAILNDVAPHDRAAQCMDSVRKHLVSEVGALLLTPAYDRPVSEIGYITRYAAGLRENGGVYTHAATWAIAAFAKIGDAATVSRLLDAINPAKRDPERYWSEPYVLPGNVDGPESPYFGRGGWTWYTGSAAWLHRVVTQWVFGVRPEWDGLLVQPCLPPSWDGATMTRPYRGCTYKFRYERSAALPAGAPPEVTLNGERLTSNLIPSPAKAGAEYDVLVRYR